MKKIQVITRKEKEENFESTAKSLKLKGKKYEKQKRKTLKPGVKFDRQGNPILWY
jgi:hypothetical protein